MKCYLCKQPTVPLFTKNGYTIYRCPSCGLCRTDLKENYDTFLRWQYAKGYFTGDVQCGAYSDYMHDKKFIVRNMQKIFKYIQRIKPTGRLLDVGCAMGYFVELALTHGYDAYGLDASRYAVSRAQKSCDGRIQLATVETAKYKPKSFDVITLLDVFEHLQNPKKDLQVLHKLLSDDGYMIIASGDTKSVLARMLGRRWTFYIPPQHLFFFDRQTISKVLELTDFEPIGWFRIGKWLSLSYILHLARTTGESRLGQWLFDVLPRGIQRIGLYIPAHDNMVVIARKKGKNS